MIIFDERPGHSLLTRLLNWHLGCRLHGEMDCVRTAQQSTNVYVCVAGHLSRKLLVFLIDLSFFRMWTCIKRPICYESYLSINHLNVVCVCVSVCVHLFATLDKNRPERQSCNEMLILVLHSIQCYTIPCMSHWMLNQWILDFYLIGFYGFSGLSISNGSLTIM